MSDSEETRSPKDVTPEEAFMIRKTAVLIGWKLSEGRLARNLHEIADELDAPQACESCSEPATTRDVEDVPLCHPCAASCPAAPDDDDEMDCRDYPR